MDLKEIVEWIYFTEDSDQWRSLVNMVMKLRVPHSWLSDCQLVIKDPAVWSYVFSSVIVVLTNETSRIRSCNPWANI